MKAKLLDLKKKAVMVEIDGCPMKVVACEAAGRNAYLVKGDIVISWEDALRVRDFEASAKEFAKQVAMAKNIMSEPMAPTDITEEKEEAPATPSSKPEQLKLF